MQAFETELNKAGITSEELKSLVIDRLELEGVKLSEFNEEHKKQIIVMYAATEIKKLQEK